MQEHELSGLWWKGWISRVNIPDMFPWILCLCISLNVTIVDGRKHHQCISCKIKVRADMQQTNMELVQGIYIYIIFLK